MSFFNLFGGRKHTEPERKIQLAPADWDNIVCPYCFERFSHKDVHFRSSTIKGNVLSEEAIEERYGDDEERMHQELEKSRIARKFMLQGNDELLSTFWSKFNITPDQRDDHEWNYPVISANDKEMLYHDEGLVYQDGFLTRVKDCFTGVSTVRLCPKCHNKLPATYGKHKVLFISVVGITGSGKTVYLNQLMESLQRHLSSVGLTATQPFNLRPNERIAKDCFLPMSTQEGVLYPPMMINIIPTDGTRGKDETTLVFYDIAGENCTAQDKLYKFGPYLLKSQAIIMLMDPKQFIQFNQNATDNPVNIVVDALVDFFETSGLRERPLMAATLSKSDKLKEMLHDFTMEEYISEDSVIFQKTRRNVGIRGFDQAGYNRMRGAMIALMTVLDRDNVISGPLRQHFEKTAFFAVSALGVEVQPKYNIGEQDEVLYVDLSKEAEHAILLLKKNRNRGGYVINPPLYNNQEQVLLGINPKTKDEVVKSFDEIKMRDNSVEYWMSENPDPCRIEEPLLWTLHELGIIKSAE